MAETKRPDDDDAVDTFDETNGLVPGIDGDDGGAADPTQDGDNLVAKFLADPLGLDPEDDGEAAETGYGEEGRP